jgi:hypothetical protein
MQATWYFEIPAFHMKFDGFNGGRLIQQCQAMSLPLMSVMSIDEDKHLTEAGVALLKSLRRVLAELDCHVTINQNNLNVTVWYYHARKIDPTSPPDTRELEDRVAEVVKQFQAA